MTQQVSIETINGKPYTVVRHDKAPSHKLFSEWRDSSIGLSLYGCYQIKKDNQWISPLLATALPALPRKPKKEDAALIDEYAAKKIYLIGKDEYGLEWQIYCKHGKVLYDSTDDCGYSSPEYLDLEIAHALFNNKPCDIAIQEAGE